MLVTTWQLAKMEGVTPSTIRRWIEQGKYKNVTKTKGGHTRIEIEEKEKRRYLYVRVSSAKQKTSITTQKRLLRKKFPLDDFIVDTASAFNFQRKGLRKILELAMSGVGVEVVVTTQDRLARSGFNLIKWILELHGGKVITLEKGANTDNFNTDELIGFITSFCNSYYGKRSAKRRSDSDCDKED